MIVQSVSSNNYQNKNIGFKMNTRIILKGFNRKYGESGQEFQKTFLRIISEELLKLGRKTADESVLIVQSDKDMSEFLAIDSDTEQKAQNCASEEIRKAFWQEILKKMKTYTLDWTKIRPQN